MNACRTLIQTSVACAVSGFFAAVAFAGPGPQYWNRPAPKPAPKVEGAPTTEAPVTGKCDGCKTTPIWVVSDRGPAGKGVPGARIVGSIHSCARCTGTVATQNGKVKDGMTHNAGCGPLLCCK